MRRAADGLHVILKANGREYRLFVPGAAPDRGAALAIALDTDLYASHRAAAALRFWRHVAQPLRPRAPLRTAPTGLNPTRLGAMLWALDLRRTGLSQTGIGQALGAVPGGDWADSADRSGIRRLLHDADRLVISRYLHLLRPTLRPTPR